MYAGLVRGSTGQLVHFEPINSITIEPQYLRTYIILQDLSFSLVLNFTFLIEITMIKLQFIRSLSKFISTNSEDTYVFINKFEKVCVMIKIQQLSDDANRLRFIPIALKDNTRNCYIVYVLTLFPRGMNFFRLSLKKLSHQKWSKLEMP